MDSGFAWLMLAPRNDRYYVENRDMPTYTVHAPPLRPGATASDPERFLFVRDGFHFWAFLLAPLWLLLRRLWLLLLLYLAVIGVLGGLSVLVRAPTIMQILVSLLFALLMGFEAATLWRWTLARRGWRMIGFAVGDDEEAAEQRFFAEWTKRAGVAPPPPASELQYATPVRRGSPTGSDVIGLFPEPGNSR
jgi:hypothetical protein